MILNGILIVDKPINLTSRDVVNKVCKALKTKKIGHTGTLDPIATGVLVLCIGKATKLVDVITSEDKEYVATVKLGILTDTFDVDGKVIKTGSITLDKEKLVDTLNSFIGTYNQEVPIYSAIKVNGKKLYEYARSGKEVEIQPRRVVIENIELKSFMPFADNVFIGPADTALTLIFSFPKFSAKYLTLDSNAALAIPITLYPSNTFVEP